MSANWPYATDDEFGPYLAEQLRDPEVRAAFDAEVCPAGEGEHCAHWWDGDACCFCHLDGPGDAVPDVVDVEIRDGLL